MKRKWQPQTLLLHPNDFRDIHENQIDDEIFETDDDNFEYSLKILRLLAYITGEKDMYYFSLYETATVIYSMLSVFITIGLVMKD